MTDVEVSAGHSHPFASNIIDLRKHFETIRAQVMTVDPQELLVGLKAIEETMVKLVAALQNAIDTCEAAERPLLAMIGAEIDKLANDVDRLCDVVLLSTETLKPR